MMNVNSVRKIYKNNNNVSLEFEAQKSVLYNVSLDKSSETLDHSSDCLLSF